MKHPPRIVLTALATLALACEDRDVVIDYERLAALEAPQRNCLTDCTPRVGVVSAFGAEADLLLAATTEKEQFVLNGNSYTTGTLAGNAVVIALSGVSMVNAAMTAQLMLDHFGVTHLVMSGIAGGLNPAHHVGDVLIPERWAMPLEAYFSSGSEAPAPCGAPGDLGCLGLRIAQATSAAGSDFRGTGLFMRETHVMTSRSGPAGEYKFAFDVDPEMLAVALELEPELARCGDLDPSVCVATQPELKIGGTGMSGPMFIANPAYREYVFETIGAEVVDMETAALGQVAYANGIPYLAFRSVSDLAGGGEDGASVGAFFGSGLAEANEARVALAFLAAWSARE